MNKKKYTASILGCYLGAVMTALGLAVLFAGFAYPSFDLAVLVLLKTVLMFGGMLLLYIGATSIIEGIHSARYWREHKHSLRQRLALLEDRRSQDV